MGIEEHLVALAGIGHQHEGTARAQFQMSQLQFAPDPAHHQPLLAPVELERLPQLELQRHEGARGHLPRGSLTPGTNEIGQHRVATAITLCLELGVQRFGGAPIALGTPSLGF